MVVETSHDLEAKRLRLLEALLEEEGLAPGGPDGLRPRPPGRPPVLSFAQERLWFLDRWDPGNPAYNIDAAFKLRGCLDADALANALGALVARHESLRSRFGERDGRPTVEVLDLAEVELERCDLLGLPEADREEARRLFLWEWARRRFDLSQAPLVRAALLATGEDQHLLLLSVHHIVADGWSMGVLMREMVAIYAAMTAARLPSL